MTENAMQDRLATAAARAPAATRDLLAPVFAQYPLDIASAEGVWLQTTHGERLLDFYGGHAVVALGYGHKGWTDALLAQAQSCSFQTNAVKMKIRARAAERLVRFSGLNISSVFFVNSGAEANENALRLAFRCRPGATQVVAVEGAFHGRTAAAGALTWGAKDKWYGFPRTPFDVSFLPRGDLKAIAEQVTGKTAAVIVEPVQGLAGAVDLGTPYLAALRKRCDEVGAILIFDEVQCGFGRLGHPYAAHLYKVVPDLITSAKALGNGYPVSAVLVGPAVAVALKLDILGTTYGGGPMACAAVEATIEAIESQELLEHVRKMGELIRANCIVGPVTGCQGAGLLVGLRTSRPAKEIHAELLEVGIFAGTASDPNVLRLLPPFIIGEEHIEILRDALAGLAA
jgi:acetylornithine/succinyldiaminopimelate/putrescine aminotransferase